MKILLVQPNTSTLRGTICPPIGIMYVGAVAREAGHEVKILDRNIDYFSLTKIRKFRPDIVGVTAMTGPMLLDALHVTRQVKKIFGGDVPVVWGGVHASILPGETLANEFIDYVVAGEGEYTFLELVEALSSGKNNFQEIRGLAFKREGEIIVNERRPAVKDLDALPMLPWDLVQAKKYFDIEIVLVTSRGCPFSCTFCISGRFGREHRYRCLSAGRVIEEIKRTERLTGNKHLKFHDDFFTSNYDYCREIFDYLSGDYSLLLYTRVTFVNQRFLDLLKKFKRVWLSFGVESGSERMLEKYRKKITTEQIRRAFELCGKQQNIRTKASVILGAPTETMEEIRMTLDFMKEISPTRRTYCVYSPYPGSELYDEAVSSGLFAPPDSIEGWAKVTMHGIDSSRHLGIDENFIRKIDNKGWIINFKNLIKEGEWYKIMQRVRDYDPFLIKLFDRIEERIL
ncbi:MAG: cobalamin B12-binding domain-containing protein [Nitrospirae bacterium]|nr:cobalamin B12-binding domain-containing protein [Nitrospirota bacterium]